MNQSRTRQNLARGGKTLDPTRVRVTPDGDWAPWDAATGTRNLNRARTAETSIEIAHQGLVGTRPKQPQDVSPATAFPAATSANPANVASVAHHAARGNRADRSQTPRSNSYSTSATRNHRDSRSPRPTTGSVAPPYKKSETWDCNSLESHSADLGRRTAPYMKGLNGEPAGPAQVEILSPFVMLSTTV
jgi:hypothetical protein